MLYVIGFKKLNQTYITVVFKMIFELPSITVA